MRVNKLLLYLFGGLLAFILVLLMKTILYPFNKVLLTSETKGAAYQPASEVAIERLAGGLQIPTVSTKNYAETDFESLKDFQAYLEKSYPAIYQQLSFFTINEHALVFRWTGKNPDLKPLLFLSHYDVVPVDGYNPADEIGDDYVLSPLEENNASTNTSWQYQPFSGQVANGRIYGRGALDMKGMLFSILEAVDSLLQEGFQPEQDIWLAFGHDEEVGGMQGAYQVAEYFQAQGLEFEAIFDEGGIIGTDGSVLKDIKQPVALIGLGEKGYLSLSIKVHGIGGHSSMPPNKTSLVYAAEIVEKLNSNQMPKRLIEPVQSFLNNVGGELSLLPRLAIANQWLLKPLLLNSLAKEPASNALVRTTTAVTMMQGSEAPNVISSTAEIIVNYRLLPGDSVADVIEHVKKQCEGYQVEINPILTPREPSAVTLEDTHGFRKIQETVHKIDPNILVSSYITIGGTDAYKYQPVSSNIYRFMPVFLNQTEQRSIHNANESITIENYSKMIYYFKELMQTYHLD